MRATTMALVLVGSMAVPVFADTPQGHIGLSSDYVFRGVSLNNESPALQAGVHWPVAAGFYAGLWGSKADVKGDVELDLYGGYKAHITRDFSYDLGVRNYRFPGESRLDTVEGRVRLNWSWLYTAYHYAPDYFGTDEAGHYLSAGADIPLPQGFKVGLGAGHSFGDGVERRYGESYNDYHLSVSKNWQGFDFGAAVTNTDLHGAEAKNADTRAVLSVGKGF